MTQVQVTQWRRTRPFWAGIFLILAAIALIVPPYATLHIGDWFVSATTVGGFSAVFIGILLLVLAGSLWLRPQYRFPAGVAALMLSLGSLVTTNLGGFVVGTLFGVIGSALALAWTD
ncbi:hypothetical protein D5S17_29820 [Pseudonocardiaceae bacterium YIM PH 21723]|nr:hypothetical protein D5S17_29820 [Pseudonocardiaceae bacterium YIM PH 21723]